MWREGLLSGSLSPAIGWEAFPLTMETSEYARFHPSSCAYSPVGTSRILTATAPFSKVSPWAFQGLKRLVAAHFVSVSTSKLFLLQLHIMMYLSSSSALSSETHHASGHHHPHYALGWATSAFPPPPQGHLCLDTRRVTVSSSR